MSTLTPDERTRFHRILRRLDVKADPVDLEDVEFLVEMVAKLGAETRGSRAIYRLDPDLPRGVDCIDHGDGRREFITTDGSTKNLSIDNEGRVEETRTAVADVGRCLGCGKSWDLCGCTPY